MSASGADIDANGATRFGAPSSALGPAMRSAMVCDLSTYGLIAFKGPDAVPFLHGQLSSDVQALTTDACQLATYNSPKGRVLSTLLLWRDTDGILVQAPAAVAEAMHKRLSMYILRSKVRATLENDRFVRLGVGGPNVFTILDRLGLNCPPADFGVTRAQSTVTASSTLEIDFLLRLPGHRIELLIRDADAAIGIWKALEASGAAPAGTAAWRWLTVRSGIPEVVAETQDQFVAQMLNLELIGAVSFNKGCYPGQEIVARTQYRGEIKRRAFLMHTSSELEPAPGEGIFAAEAPEQAVGTVLMAAPSPEGGTDMLACLHVDLTRRGVLRLGNPNGPAIESLALPYKLPTTT